MKNKRKLSDVQIMRIMKLANRIPQRQLAKRFHVDQSTISRVIKGAQQR